MSLPRQDPQQSVVELDADSAQVAHDVCRIHQQVLGARLAAFVVHGSAVTGYLPRVSDFDFVLGLRGPLTIDDAVAIQREVDQVHSLPGPFSYLQLSRVLDFDDVSLATSGLIEGGYVVVLGELPTRLRAYSEEELRQSGRHVLAALPAQTAKHVLDWATDTGLYRTRRLRLMLTELKPVVRALLVQAGEPVVETWLSDYHRLGERLAVRDQVAATELLAIVTLLANPGVSAPEVVVGERLLRLLIRLTP